ncbi:MAG: YesL family protein [Oscillospiraceae bacterium]|nr:YesL family protein [Oscillospiraceae bacterium]
MGFFSNRYTKEGPGVSKNEPEKKDFIKFFEIYFRNFWKLCTANLLTILCSIPLLTYGVAETGLTYVARATARDRHTFVSSDFFDTIKKNWKQGLIIGIIDFLLLSVIVFDFYFAWTSTTGTFNVIMLALTFLVFILFSFSKYYRYMMVVTFKMSVWKVYKNSFIFAVAGLFKNFVISLILLICYAIAFAFVWFANSLGITIVLLLYVCVFRAFRAYLIQFNVFPIIRKFIIDPYYNEHPDDDIEKRKDLGIYIEEDETNDATCNDDLII